MDTAAVVLEADKEQEPPPSMSMALMRLGFTPEELIRFMPEIRGGTIRWLSAGEVLIWEGDPPGPAYILSKGRLEVRKRRPDGSEDRVAVLGPGSVVGEMSWVLGQPRSATVAALEDVEVVTIEHEELLRLKHECRGFSAHLDALIDRRRGASSPR